MARFSKYDTDVMKTIPGAMLYRESGLKYSYLLCKRQIVGSKITMATPINHGLSE